MPHRRLPEHASFVAVLDQVTGDKGASQCSCKLCNSVNYCRKQHGSLSQSTVALAAAVMGESLIVITSISAGAPINSERYSPHHYHRRHVLLWK